MALFANCGKELPDGVKFCGFCGALQPQAGNTDVTLGHDRQRICRRNNSREQKRGCDCSLWGS